MEKVLLLVALVVVGALGNQEPCNSGKFTSGGECCRQCQPGEGVKQPCGDTQTVCASCLDSETFSESWSHTEVCQPCTRCTGPLRMETPCTDSNDAACVCDYGLYLSPLSGRCEGCTRCLAGHGMLYSCEHDRDTVCEKCMANTYSDQESAREPCLPCTVCEEGEEVEIEACTSEKDTVCKDLNPPSSLPPSSSPESFVTSDPYEDEDFPGAGPPPDGPTEAAGGATDGPKLVYEGLNDKLIPIYCSILAAVVLGLVAFIIFKRWNSCKQNKQGANSCSAGQNQTPSPEGEKLHSDSGISVDSQSLDQTQSQAQTVLRVDEAPCVLLPLHTTEELERLLFRGEGCESGEGSDWCSLAGLLGYEEQRISSFCQEEHPVRALLSDWASQDCASVDALCTALRKINRDDVAQSLALSPNANKPTATSVV